MAERVAYREPDVGVVRRSGFAHVGNLTGYTRKYQSCAACADILGVPWTVDFFEGECVGCEVALSGFPVNG